MVYKKDENKNINNYDSDSESDLEPTPRRPRKNIMEDFYQSDSDDDEL